VKPAPGAVVRPEARAAAPPLERLAKDPQRFDFDAGVRVLLHAAGATDPGSVVRFRSVTGLAYPPADIMGLTLRDEGLPPDLMVSVMGLTGPSGVLPRSYTETVNQTLRARSGSLRDFLDLLSHRMLALFASAATKYRPNRIFEISRLSGRDADGGDPFTSALLSLTGYGTPHLVDRFAAGPEPLGHYSGFLTPQPRSAERLRAMVSDWLGRPVEVRQFVGAWLKLTPDERTRLPGRGVAGQFNRIGFAPELAMAGAGANGPAAAPPREDAAIGVRAWDAQAGITLRIGPLNRESFIALLPDRPLLGRLVALVRAYLGYATGFSINPVVEAAAVPALQLRADADPPPRLGWNTWLTAPEGSRRKDAAEAVFEAEVVEARMAALPHAAE
jgi:type VI secretion system protein ImpH